MRSVWLIIGLLALTGCAGSPMPETVVAPAALPDCSQTIPLFEAFSLSAKKVDWKGQKVTITFVITNISNRPATMNDGANGVAISFPSMNLVNASGVTYMAGEPVMPFAGVGFVNPGIRKEFSVGFEVPPGQYVLAIGRETNEGGVLVQRPNLFRCNLRA